MKKISIKELFNEGSKYIDQEVVIEGWVRTNRAQKEFGFLNVKDGSYLDNAQIVYEQNLSNLNDVSKFRVGSFTTRKPSINIKLKIKTTL